MTEAPAIPVPRLDLAWSFLSSVMGVHRMALPPVGADPSGPASPRSAGPASAGGDAGLVLAEAPHRQDG